ncbi:Peptidase M48 domain-containing protein [Dioscorea alata]|uniref:Peptidase M48 domain-containing protein n=1 Tax=Dioscorea alata TaxID=55571 RepID=A0ACB7VB19_DIOAL|nr:Peptidase M48 domain-containing protein [Dioscorea alata]
MNCFRNSCPLPLAIFLVGVLCGGAITTIYYSHLEIVPYTKRSHLVLLSPSVERRLGELLFQQRKNNHKDSILPSTHPDSVRVSCIAKNIIKTLQRGLQHDKWRCGDLDKFKEETLVSRKETVKAQSSSLVPQTRHLEGLNWEVLVVKNSKVNAYCMPGGKIVIFTGLLDHLRTDAEIATVIGHEIAHVIASHHAEKVTRELAFVVVRLILLHFCDIGYIPDAMYKLLLQLPFSRRMEKEADYIGLLLMASAGYDPHVAPSVYEKLGQIKKKSRPHYISTHPSPKERAELLSQAEVMEEARSVYADAVSGHVVSGFL